jgi:hypothetical protein
MRPNSVAKGTPTNRRVPRHAIERHLPRKGSQSGLTAIFPISRAIFNLPIVPLFRDTQPLQNQRQAHTMTNNIRPS